MCQKKEKTLKEKTFFRKKYSNKLSMKALVGKSMFMKNKIQRGTSFYTPFFHIYFFETQGNSKELKGTHLNSFELIELKGTVIL